MYIEDDRFNKKAFVDTKGFFSFLEVNERAESLTFDTELLRDGFTFSFWVYIDSASVPNTTQCRIIAIDNGASFEMIKIEWSSNGASNDRMRILINGVLYETPNIFPRSYGDRLIHYCVSYDGSEVKQYVNSRLLSTHTVTVAPVFTSSDRLRVGNGFNDATTRRLIGDVAHVNVFSKGLSRHEVEAVFRYGGFLPENISKYNVLNAPCQEDMLYAYPPDFGALDHYWASHLNVTLNAGKVEVWEASSGWKGRQTTPADMPSVVASGSNEGDIGASGNSYLVIEDDLGTVTPLSFGVGEAFEIHIFSLNGANNCDLGGYNFAALLQRFNATDLINIFTTGSGGTTNVQASFSAINTSKYAHKAISRDGSGNVKVYYRDDTIDEVYTHGVAVNAAIELDFIGTRSIAAEPTLTRNGDTTSTFLILVYRGKVLSSDEHNLVRRFVDANYFKGVSSADVGAGKRKVLSDVSNKYNSVKNYSNEGVDLSDWTITLNGGTNTVVQNPDNIQIDKNEAGEPSISKLSSGVDVSDATEYTFELDVEVDAGNNGQFASLTLQLGGQTVPVSVDKTLGRNTLYGNIVASGTSDNISISIDNSDVNTPKIVRLYGIRVYEKGQRVIEVPNHLSLANKVDSEIGSANLTNEDSLPEFYNRGVRIDGGLVFDHSSTNYVDVPSISGPLINEFTLVAICKPQDSNKNYNLAQMTGGVAGEFRLSTLNSELSCGDTIGGDAIISLPSGFDPTSSYHVYIVTKNSSNEYRFWLNGRELTSSAISAGAVTFDSVAIGQGTANIDTFGGVYGVFVCYDSVLSDVDIKTIGRKRTIIGSPLLHHSYRNVDEETLVFDSSGNGNNGTLVSFPSGILKGDGSWLEASSFLPKTSQFLKMDGVNHYISTKNVFDPTSDVYTIFIQASTLNTDPVGTWGAKTVLAASNLLSSNDSITLTLRNEASDTDGNDGVPSFYVYSGGVAERSYELLGASKLYNGLYSTLIQYNKTSIDSGDNFCVNDLVNKVLASGGLVNSSDFSDVNQKLHIGVDVANSAKTEMYISRLLIWNRKLKQSEIVHLTNYGNPPVFDPISNAYPQKGLILDYQFNQGNFVEGSSEPEVKNLAPVSNFPVGSALVPSDWDGECFGYTGATVADRLSDLRGQVMDIKILR